MRDEPEAYKDVEYKALTDESGYETTSQRRRQRWSLASFGIGFVAAALLTSTVFLVARALNHPATTEELEAQEWNNCGRSSHEAMERGCVMDPPLYAWVPPQCYYNELTSSLPPIFENRQYYSDVNMTQAIATEDLYLGEHTRIYTMR